MGCDIIAKYLLGYLNASIFVKARICHLCTLLIFPLNCDQSCDVGMFLFGADA
jgi:hypothetical protein